MGVFGWFSGHIKYEALFRRYECFRWFSSHIYYILVFLSDLWVLTYGSQIKFFNKSVLFVVYGWYQVVLWCFIYKSVYRWCQMAFWSYSQRQKTVQAAKRPAIHVLNPIPGQITEGTRNISNRLESNLPLYYSLCLNQTRCILRFLIGCPRQELDK